MPDLNPNPQPTETTPTPAPAPTSEAPADDLSGIRDILAFDPFEEGAEPPADPSATNPPAAETSPPSPPSSAEQPPVEGSQGTQSPPATPPTTEPAPQLVETLQAIQATLARQSEPPPQEQPQAEGPKFAQVNLPPELVGALRSEDPREFSAGLSALTTGILNMAYNAFKEDMTKFQNEGLPAFFQQQQMYQAEASRVQADFYGAYKELDRPELRPVVTNAGQQVMAEWARQGKSIAWNAELREAVAQRVLLMLGAVRPATAPAAAPAAPFTPAPSARPAIGAPDDIMDTLFG